MVLLQSVIVLAVFLVLIAIIVISLITIRKRKKAKKDIPEDVLKDFEELERRSKDSAGVQTPEEILWEFTKEKMKGGEDARRKEINSRPRTGITEEHSEGKGDSRYSDEPAAIQPLDNGGNAETKTRDEHYHRRFRRLD